MQTDFGPDPVLEDIERFIKAAGMSPTAFGIQAMNDPTLVHELRNGRECKRATRARILKFIRQSSDTTGEAA